MVNNVQLVNAPLESSHAYIKKNDILEASPMEPKDHKNEDFDVGEEIAAPMAFSRRLSHLGTIYAHRCLTLVLIS
jgi:hypothetical protein